MSTSVRLGAMIVAAGMLAAPAAFGDANVHFNAKIRLVSHGTQMQYHGRVRSNSEACQVGRTVRISETGHLIGKTATGDNGKFSLVANAVEDGSSVKFKLKPNGPDCPAALLFVEI
jgi:hypothetical protein